MRHLTPIGLVGLGVLLLGVLLPVDWYYALPRSPELPPLEPMNGVLLLKLSLVAQGVVLLGLGLRGWRFRRIAEADRLPGVPEAAAGDLTARQAGLLLAVVVLVAAGLRLYRIGADLWLDEITPILFYGHMSPLEVIASYSRSNNHLLNTLLVQLSTWLFGEGEWAVRLPAVLFGIGTIPVLYWIARLGLTRWASLASALLLATSYHHVFFSQNARGYASYLFFSLLATGLLIRALQQDRPRLWAVYVLATVLNFASLLISGFVFAAHLLVGLIALLVLRRRGRSPAPMARRLTGVFALAGFMGFQLYALVLPDIYSVIQKTYTSPSTGFTPFSSEFLGELARGISAGFGTGLLLGALPFLLMAGYGFWSLLHRQWALAAALGLALALGAALLIGRGLTFSPRFFILALPLAILSAVQGVYTGVEWLSRSLKWERTDFAGARLATPLVVLIAAASGVSLQRYFEVPKQPYRASLQYVEAARQPDGAVIVLHLAEKGYRYYGRKANIQEGKDYFFVRTEEALEEVLASQRSRNIYVVTTFPRALRMALPELNDRLQAEWELSRDFSATVGDGGIQVWKPRQRKRTGLAAPLSLNAR